MKKILVAIVAVFTLSLGLVGCNTVQGFGQDLEAGGKGLSKAAERTKGDDATAKKKHSN